MENFSERGYKDVATPIETYFALYVGLARKISWAVARLETLPLNLSVVEVAIIHPYPNIHR